MKQLRFHRKAITLLIALILGACSTEPSKPTGGKPTSPESSKVTPEEGKHQLAQLAEKSRQKVKNQTFEEFEKTVYKEPFSGGKYIVNGDTPITDIKQLREFYDGIIAEPPPPAQMLTGESAMIKELAVYHRNVDIIWNSLDKKRLSYCVSTAFGNNHQQVVEAMRAATGAWESVADVHYIYESTQDGNCNANNKNVIFDVNPVNANGQYLARAFFPNESRGSRNVLIDASAFKREGVLTLTGILRHELGHTLGFRHEQTRPEAHICFEDTDWRGVTNYDAFSVMHYPQCNGKGDWSLKLTELDKQGVACTYGAANGFSIDPTKCIGPATPNVPTPTTGIKTTKKFLNQQTNRNEEKSYGPFVVVPKTIFTVEMLGNRNPGDPDLYVGFNGKPERLNRNTYSCRPYVTGANERCSIDVPPVGKEVYILIHGFTAGNFNLTVDYVKPR